MTHSERIAAAQREIGRILAELEISTSAQVSSLMILSEDISTIESRKVLRSVSITMEIPRSSTWVT
jgi:hypothetical protein